MRSFWSSSPSAWHLTTQSSLASSANPIFCLHLTCHVLQPFHSLHLNKFSISQMPAISCVMFFNFPTESAGDLGNNFVFFSNRSTLFILASNTPLTTSRLHAGFLLFELLLLKLLSYLPCHSLETKYPQMGFMCPAFSCCDVKSNCVALATSELSC